MLQTIPLAISAASALGGLINSFRTPKFGLSEEDVNRMIDLQMNRALTEQTANSRRRLAAAGLGGSGVVDSILSDHASRIRSQFEEERARLMQAVKQGQYQSELTAFENRSNALGGLASLGFGAYQLSQGNPFQKYLDQLGAMQSADLASLTPNNNNFSGIGSLQKYFANNPYQSPRVDLGQNNFQQLPASTYDPFAYGV